ncbi:MAG: hypothetical protein P1U70_08640, partial [Saprospiraceae bacterium]|nr:hypothetical protein [Saprospiraceae bacterium]
LECPPDIHPAESFAHAKISNAEMDFIGFLPRFAQNLNHKRTKFDLSRTKRTYRRGIPNGIPLLYVWLLSPVCDQHVVDNYVETK